MPRWASTAEIAGVVFTGCRAEILDGAKFASPIRGSVDWGNDGTPNTQIINIGQKGIPFGVSMLSNETSKIKDALDAINYIVGIGGQFRVHIVDELYTIDVYALPDYNQDWFATGRPAEGWVENVVFRFVSLFPFD